MICLLMRKHRIYEALVRPQVRSAQYCSHMLSGVGSHGHSNVSGAPLLVVH